MEKFGLMKEIDKWSSTVKIWRKIKSRVARCISHNTLNERSRASFKRGKEWIIHFRDVCECVNSNRHGWSCSIPGKRKSDRRRREERCLLGKVFFLCSFSPIYGIANIPLDDIECDVDIAHVLEVRAPDCEIAIALEYIVLRFRY